MATKKICDRCGAEINPYYSGKKLYLTDYNGLSANNFGKDGDIAVDLCVSCAFHLRKWLNGEEGADNG